MPRTARPASAAQPARSSIVDVARLAGVSVATVSRALRGLPNVSEATRQRVLHAASELEYIASPLAAALVTGRTRSVGVIASAAEPGFFTEAVCGIEGTLREAGYDVLLHVVPDGERREQFFADLPVRRRVDGLVLVGLRLTEAETEALHGLRVPLVSVAEELPGVHTERIDDRAAGALAATHLLDLGHTRIGLVGEPVAGAPGERTRGARAAITAAGLEPVAVEPAPADVLAGHPTGLVCESDEQAFVALNVMRLAGLRCPHDVSVIGFGDHELSAGFGLSTVAQPVAAEGSAAALWLVEALDAEGALSAPPHVHPVTLIARTSTAPPGA